MIPGEALILLVLLLLAAVKRPAWMDEPERLSEIREEAWEWQREEWEAQERPSYEPQEVES